MDNLHPRHWTQSGLRGRLLPMKTTHTMTTVAQHRPTGIVQRFMAVLERGMASDIVSYPATRGVGVVVLPHRSSKRAAVADIVGGVSDRETLAAA